MRYNGAVERTISVRLDQESERALRFLTASGASRSEVVRAALVGLERQGRRRAELAEEVRTLDADPDDRVEQFAVMALMAFSAVADS